jgi:hypothetical protein
VACGARISRPHRRGWVLACATASPSVAARGLTSRDTVALPVTPGETGEPGIAALVLQLHVIERKLMASTSSEAAEPARHARALVQAQTRLSHDGLQDRQAIDSQSALLNALPAHVALLDAAGFIVSVNDAWTRFATSNGFEMSDRLDVMIAGVTDGFYTLDRQWRFTYLNLMSGKARREKLHSSLEEGAAAFIVKPFTRDSSLSNLQKILG